MLNQWLRWGSIILIGILLYKAIWIILVFLQTDLTNAQRGLKDCLIICISVGILLESLRWIHRKLERRLPWAANPIKRFFWQVALDIPATVIITSALTSFNSIFIYHDYYYLSGDVKYIIRNLSLINAMCLVLVAGDVGVELGGFLVRQWHNSLMELERFKKESLEAQLQALKSQINPHFLFNSLNTLSSLIYVNQDAAAEFVRQLSKVYRYVLEYREKEVIPLATELTILQAYQYLVETRFEEKLRFTVTLAEELQQYCIPPLTLQILIENAIKHNVVSKAQPLQITIFPEQYHYLVVQNTLQRKSSTEYSSKIGLKNIISRYRYLTDRPVLIEETDATFTVKIPLLEDPQIEEKPYANRNY
jgi:two-component system, LytTR family, sensor kinase